MATDKRLKVLISAYACSPYQGSEPGVGWGFVSALAKYHDLWIIVEKEKFRSDIEQYFSEHPETSHSMHFYYLPKKRNRFLRKIWPPSYYWYYRRWHKDALEFAQKLHTEIGFDIAHQLTMVGFREPGYLWKLNIPFAWGPIGGMGLFPFRFLTSVGIYGSIYYLGYNLANLLQMYLLRRPKLAAVAAGSAFITATTDNMQGANEHFGVPSTLISEIGLPESSSVIHTRRQQGDDLRIIWIGSHTPGKALNLGLLALAKVSPDVNWQLHIFGKGPQTFTWKTMAEELLLANRCHFHGSQPRSQVMEYMSNSHVLLITSLKDLTSTVTVEALSHGLPVICPDHCGFADAVNKSCGIKIPVENPRQVVNDLSKAIELLAQNEELRRKLAVGAQARSQDYSWDNKARLINDIYHKKITEHKASRQ